MKWKRIIGRSLAGLALLLILAAVGGYFYLKSNSFQSFAIRQIVDRANLATGGKTEISGLDFDLKTLTAHLYNITLHGTEAPASRLYFMPTNSQSASELFPPCIVRLH